MKIIITQIEAITAWKEIHKEFKDEVVTLETTTISTYTPSVTVPYNPPMNIPSQPSSTFSNGDSTMRMSAS